jgi:adenylate cyclase
MTQIARNSTDVNYGFLRSNSSSFTTSPNGLASVFRQSARSINVRTPSRLYWAVGLWAAAVPTAARVIRRDSGDVMTREHFRILAAGECSAVLPVLAQLARDGSSFRMLPFSSVEDVAMHLQYWTLDLLFVDADCTRVSAAKLCRALKEHPSTRLLPVLVVSCSARACGKALAAGADDFLTPQIPRQVLLTRLEAHTQLSLARRKVALALIEADEPLGETIRQKVHHFLLPRTEARILGKRGSFAGPPDGAQAVVLLAALRGFNRLCEYISPERLKPLLDEYCSLLSEITYQHEGTIFQTDGRCLLVGFGVGHGPSHGAERAFRAAQEMLTRFDELADVWRKRFRLLAGLSIGLNEGSVAAATGGGPRFTYSALIGDAVNVASHLCQRARAGEMVLSAALKHSLDAQGLIFPAMGLPPISVRGRSQPVDIFCSCLQRRMNLYGQAPWNQRAPSDQEILEVSAQSHGRVGAESHRP